MYASYDLHTLQNRFYLHHHTIATLQSTIPVLLRRIQRADIDCVAFPDEGAAERFGSMFKQGLGTGSRGYDIITCGKTRDGAQRTVSIQQGLAQDKHVLIVDDLVQTGGTLFECACALKAAGARCVSVFVAHAVFPKEGWRRFARGGDRSGVFHTFFLTNSVPTVTDALPADDVFEVLQLQQQIIDDLDGYT